MISSLRKDCQKGEMPHQKDLPFDLRDVTGLKLYRLYWADGLYLDSLAAIQQTLWPGSMMDCYWTFSDVDGWKAHVAIADPKNVGENLAIGESCPTLACAWLDAMLAGLQEKNDG